MSSAIFPSLPGLAWGIVKRPIWNTRIQESAGGYETRISFTSLPRWRWSLPFQFMRQAASYAEFQSLADFFNSRQGRYDSFLYSDPSDNAIAAADRLTLGNFGTGDGSTVAFQLGRQLASGGLFEPIYNVNGTPAIYKDNALQSTPANYTVSASGLVTFTSAPANGVNVNWYGGYYWRCRFDDDAADFTEFLDAYWSLSALAFKSILGS